MALIIENGSIVPNANSYVTRAELITYAALRGVTIDDVDASDLFLISAMDYLETFRYQFKGNEVQPGAQPLAFPRECLSVGAYTVGSDVIPSGIKNAQIALAMEAKNGTVLLPTQKPTQGGVTLIRQKLGPLEKEFAVTPDTSTSLDVPAATAALSPFLRSAGATRAYRV